MFGKKWGIQSGRTGWGEWGRQTLTVVLLQDVFRCFHAWIDERCCTKTRGFCLDTLYLNTTTALWCRSRTESIPTLERFVCSENTRDPATGTKCLMYSARQQALKDRLSWTTWPSTFTYRCVDAPTVRQCAHCRALSFVYSQLCKRCCVRHVQPSCCTKLPATHLFFVAVVVVTLSHHAKRD